MGGAIAYGAISQGVVTPHDVAISHLSSKMEHLFAPCRDKIVTNNRNSEVIAGADLIIIAVKPWLVEEVLSEITPIINRGTQALISVVAGLSFERLSAMLDFDRLGAMPLYRVIPNTAIAIGEGVSIISRCGTSEELDRSVVELFEALGSTFVVDEPLMAPLTSLSSCGIAFALRYIGASMQGGIEVGIDPDMSLEVVLKTVKGAVAMLERNASQPQTEIDKVTTKGGITLKGLEAMERNGFSQATISGVKESR